MKSDKPHNRIIPDLSFIDYQRLDGINHSILKLFGRSAAHAREAMLHPADPTAAQHLGQAIHAAILEPEMFASEYAAAPKVDRRTTVGKQTWAAFTSENEGKLFLTDNEFSICERLSEACWSDATIADILGGPGHNEVAAQWMGQDGKYPCKARVDRLTEFGGWSVIVDLKSTRDASPGAFARHCVTYGYHTQAAWCLDGLNAVAPLDRRHILIAFEKEPPFAVAVYELDSVSIEQARDDNEKRFRAFVKANESGDWPGYTSGVQTLSIPKWAIRPDEWGTE